MNWGQCPRCKDYKLNWDRCPCKSFLCWYDDAQNDPDQAIGIYAVDREFAVEEMARRYYDGSDGLGTIRVWVEQDDGTKKAYIAEASIKVEFLVREDREVKEII